MTSKIRIRVGNVEVEYEGNESFLEKKLPALIEEFASLAGGIANDDDLDSTDDGGAPETAGKVGTLAAFLKAASIGDSKTKKFLATAAWLHKRGKSRLATSDVSRALKGNHQSGVGNASQCLVQNVKAGHCEKAGKTFFVTPEGRASLKR